MSFKKGVWFFIPSILGLGIFYIIPFIGSMNYAFIGSGFDAGFVGMQNFAELFSSNLFQIATRNTLVFSLVMVPIIVLISLILSVLASKNSFFCKVFKSSLVVAYMLPTVALVLMWRILFDVSGPLNAFLSLFGIEKINWIYGGYMRVPIIVMYIWKNLGFNIIILTAALFAIPTNIIESSKIDGANWFVRLFRIILPQITPTIFFVMVISLINSLRIFKEAYFLGGPYPDDTAYTIQHFINNQFGLMRYNIVVASSLMFVGIIYLLVFLLFRVENRMRVN